MCGPALAGFSGRLMWSPNVAELKRCTSLLFADVKKEPFLAMVQNNVVFNSVELVPNLKPCS